MKENYTHKSKFFCGNQISDYGLKHGYIDYKTLAKCGDMVLCNDITKLFYGAINGEYVEPEQVNGFIDNSDEIDELQEQMDELMDEYNTTTDPQREKEIDERIAELQIQIDDLQAAQDDPGEIFQYFIISDNLAEILKDFTNEILFYLPALNVYVWGVTHYGTSWDYVLTDIKLDLGGENE